MRVGWSKKAIFTSFARYIFRTFTFKDYYIVLCSPVSGSSFTPKRMTLNDNKWSFCVKIWFRLGIQWVGVLALGENWQIVGKFDSVHQVVFHYLYSGSTEDVSTVNINWLRSLQAALYSVLVSMLGCLEEDALLGVNAVPGLERLERR